MKKKLFLIIGPITILITCTAYLSLAAPPSWQPDFGTGLNQSDDDSDFVPMGINFNFYGIPHNFAFVNANGNLTFNAPNYTYSSPDIPEPGLAIIAPLYGDFNPSVHGDVYYNNTVPGEFTATWVVVPEYLDVTADYNTFQTTLFECSGAIRFGYDGLTTDGINWNSSSISMDVGIANTSGSLYINSASGNDIPLLDQHNIFYVPENGDYVEVIDPYPFEKAITGGPDVDGDGEIDLAVEVGKLSSTEYSFAITYENLGCNNLAILDTLPAEWDANGHSASSGTVMLSSSNKKNNGKSSTQIRWELDPVKPFGSLEINAVTRQSNGKKNNQFKPTSCGNLTINDGAKMFQVDEYGEIILPAIATTNSLCLVAVSDYNDDGTIDYTGSGDEDGDGISDYDEACTYGTNPCDPEDYPTCGNPAITDICIDTDGTASAGTGGVANAEVKLGDPLTAWPTGSDQEGIDWFDNDSTCTWTTGDDIHVEGAAFPTAARNSSHDANAMYVDPIVLDLDNSLFDGQQVDVDLETGSTFTGCTGVDPALVFFNSNGTTNWDNGEDIILDVNGNGIFD